MSQGNSRAANGRSSIYFGKDGYWHGRVTMGVRDDGKPDRRHTKSKNRAKVASKVRELERQRDEGIVTKPGRAWTVERWLNHWLENIAKPSVRYKTYVGYRTAVYKHLIPGLGARRLDRLEPEHLEKLMHGCRPMASKPERPIRFTEPHAPHSVRHLNAAVSPAIPPSLPSHRELTRKKLSHSKQRKLTAYCAWP